jgi:4,5-dihydroxyphthalate decarboxylase
MPKKLALTLACGDYEIIRPLLRGKVEVDGVDLTILTDMDSATRHWRFLNNNEFDIAEVSGSSYLAARDNDLPFRAVTASCSSTRRKASPSPPICAAAKSA